MKTLDRKASEILRGLLALQKSKIDNTDGAYIFYDPENETNLKHLYRMMIEKEPFYVKKLSFDDLNELAENFYEN